MTYKVSSCDECQLLQFSDWGVFCRHPKAPDENISLDDRLNNTPIWCPLKLEPLTIEYDQARTNTASN